MRELNNMQITSNEIANNKYMQIYLTKKELEKQETKEIITKYKGQKYKIEIMEYFDEIISKEVPNRYILENIIDTIWIYSNKSVKFDLKVDIEKLI